MFGVKLFEVVLLRYYLLHLSTIRNIYQKTSKHTLLLVEEVLHDNRCVI